MVTNIQNHQQHPGDSTDSHYFEEQFPGGINPTGGLNQTIDDDCHSTQNPPCGNEQVFHMDSNCYGTIAWFNR
jgi:hypothetical protein